MNSYIEFNSKTKLFTLGNKFFQYKFFINSKNYLQHIYFGKPIKDFEFDETINLNWDWSKTYLDENDVEHLYEDNYYNDRSLMEVPSQGAMDKRGSLVKIRDKNGSTYTKFKYVSHVIYNGKPILKTLPSSHTSTDECKTLEIHLKEESRNVEMILCYTIFDNLSIIVRNTKIVNKSNEIINLLKANSICVNLPESNFDLIHFHGDWCMERFKERKPLSNLKNVIESNYGRSSHEKNPFVILCDKQTNEQNGRAFAFSFVYSGNFKIEVNVDKWRSTRVLMGINDEDFDFTLKENDEFEFPEGVIVYTEEGLNGISHNMHDFVRNNLIKYKNAKKHRPLLFNAWEGCYLDFNTQVILDYMEQAKSVGSELFVLDDGWFGKRDSDDRSLGDWFVYEDKLNLKKVIDKCHDLGMKFGIWFEPEMINSNSELYRKNPNYALGGKGNERTLSRHQLVLDTTNEQAINDVFDMMCNILDNYDIDYVKWDHNRNVGEISSAVSYGETYHRLILGTYKLLDMLQKKYPNVFFEGCASGGGRFDLGMLYYNPQIWTSDETDPVQRLFIQYGTSYAYPLSTMGSHISKSKMTSFKTKAHIALFGTYGIEMNHCTLTKEDKKEIQEVNELYHKYHNDVIANGDLYRLSCPFETNYMSMMSVSKDKNNALVLFVNKMKENNRYRFLKLQGLDRNCKYLNNYDNKTYYGDYYMNVGINLTRWLDEFSSFVIVLTKQD